MSFFGFIPPSIKQKGYKLLILTFVVTVIRPKTHTSGLYNIQACSAIVFFKIEKIFQHFLFIKLAILDQSPIFGWNLGQFLSVYYIKCIYYEQKA